MRFLADQGISPKTVAALAEAGHDAVHVRSIGMSRAADSDILQAAEAQMRIILTEDTDFGGLLVVAERKRPSVILFRDHSGRAAVRTRLLLEHLPQIAGDLAAGAIVVIDDASVR